MGLFGRKKKADLSIGVRIGNDVHTLLQPYWNSLAFPMAGYSAKLRPRVRAGVEDTSEACVRVYVRTKFPGLDISGLPKDIDGTPVDVVELGDVAVRVPVPDPRVGHLGSVMSGCSVGHERTSAGTMSCMVFDDLGNPYLLSNRHVLAPKNMDPRIGDDIYQPGPLDARATDPNGNLNPVHRAARLLDWASVSVAATNYVDAAIAVPTGRNWFRYEPVGDDYQGVTQVYEAKVNDRVKKVGRTTGRTNLVVVDDSAVITVTGEDGFQYRYADQVIAVSSDDLSKPGSAPGDSGSLVVWEDPQSKEERAVGLLFAGSDTHTIICKMWRVLDYFSVTLTNPLSPSQIWGEAVEWPLNEQEDDVRYQPSEGSAVVMVVEDPGRETHVQVNMPDQVRTHEPFDVSISLVDGETGKGIPNAVLRLVGAGYEPEVVTDGDGVAVMPGRRIASPGPHTLTAKYAGKG